MEGDIIRSSGNDTLVDLWIGGQSREITVTKGAIQAYLGTSVEGEGDTSPEGLRRFVRTHLGVLSRAVSLRLRVNPSTTAVTIAAGDLPAHL